MLALNQHTKRTEVVNVGDTLYIRYEGDENRTGGSRQRTVTFRVMGLLEYDKQQFIIGPGDILYQLGVNCFKTSQECWQMINCKDQLYSKDCGFKLRLDQVADEERMVV